VKKKPSSKRLASFHALGRFSVYCGRERLGHCVQISQRRYAAYDCASRFLGKFSGRKAACLALVKNAEGAAQ